MGNKEVGFVFQTGLSSYVVNQGGATVEGGSTGISFVIYIYLPTIYSNN